MNQTIEIGRREGLSSLHRVLLPQNAEMRLLLEKVGFEFAKEMSNVSSAELTFNDEQTKPAAMHSRQPPVT
jgi:hypothetical protein